MPHHQIFLATLCFLCYTLYCRQIFFKGYVQPYGLMSYGWSTLANFHEKCFFFNDFLIGEHFKFNEANYCRRLFRFYQEHFLLKYFIQDFFSLFSFICILFNSFFVNRTADGTCNPAQIAITEKSLVCIYGAYVFLL